MMPRRSSEPAARVSVMDPDDDVDEVSALILVDYQNDFCEGGALPVRGGLTLKPKIQTLLQLPFHHIIASMDYHPPNHISFGSQHPEIENPLQSKIDVSNPLNPDEKASIALWPDHCVQHTPGAFFVDGLDISMISHVVRKGVLDEMEEYSPFGSSFQNPEPSPPRVETMEQFLKVHRNEQRQEAHYQEVADWVRKPYAPKPSLLEFLRERKVTRVYLAGLALDYCVKFTMIHSIRYGFNVSLIKDCVAAVNPGSLDWVPAFTQGDPALVQYVTLAEVIRRLVTG